MVRAAKIVVCDGMGRTLPLSIGGMSDPSEAIIDAARSAGGNMGVTSGRQAIEEGAEPLAARNIIHVERGGRFRVRERTVLRYYARTLQHLLTGTRRHIRTH